MLNYIAAELYKLRHKKLLFFGMALLLALESLACLPGLWISEQERGVWLSAILLFLSAVLPLGLFVAPIFAALAFDGQHQNATLKNEVVFGIPRGRIYLGKLLAAAITGTVCAAAALAWFALMAALLMPVVVDPAGQLLLGHFGWNVLRPVFTAWLGWLSALSFTMLLLFVIKSSAGAMVIVYVVSVVGVPISAMGAGPSASRWIKLAIDVFYSTPYLRLFWGDGAGTPHPLLYAGLVCMLWVGVTTGLGVLIFQRKELK